ncbi:putative RNA-binding protein EEED8.10 [Panulirus ornatus]|uniref:putative RNA-binding protein EEED8.10 n=1 Tax=Panulirus ornatus TaxID=150431 RepID=UPI003A8945AC
MFAAGNYENLEKRRGGYRAARGRGRGRDRENNQEAVANSFANMKICEEIPEELIEPCKVYVGNLRPRVGERDLLEALSHYVPVLKVIIIKDKNGNRSKGYGFVKVRSPEDVQILLNLKDGNLYIHGQKMIIRPARKRISLPGDNDYVRRPLPDRDFDLSHPNPNSPTIHILVDDVLYKILEYLPIKDLVRCERVCRRWQMLVHGMFTKVTRLEIAPGNLGLFGPITSNIISKLLILSGPTLKSLKLQSIEHATRRNILKIVGQLCPELQCLDVTRAHGVNFHNISELADKCKNLKSFIAKKCPMFGDKALNHLLCSYQNLERLDISGCPVSERWFDLLPYTLKELNISNCSDIHLDYGMMRIGDICPNLETLEMENVSITNSVLENIANGCSKLTKLHVTIVDPDDFLYSLKKLQSLTVDSGLIEPQKIIDNMPDLQSLEVVARIRSNGEADFSSLKDLKSITLSSIILTPTSLRSLSRCPDLEEVDFRNCGGVTKEVLLDILRGCPNMKKIRCPDVDMNLDFIAAVNKIMEGRSGKVFIEVRAESLSPKELLEAQYNSKKIEFDLISGFPFLDDYGDENDYDDDESLYSKDSMDDLWNCQYGLHDELFYAYHLDYLHNAFGFYGVCESDAESDFSI